VSAVWQMATGRGNLSVRRVDGAGGEIDLVLSEQRAEFLPRELESLGLRWREADVLHWILEGKSNEVIATILSTSKRTVDKQVENILRKLGVESRVTAAWRAERHRQA
jgi:DNA-binding NarL/FixJ family response regulator